MNIVISGAAFHKSCAVKELWRNLITEAHHVLYIGEAIEKKNMVEKEAYFFKQALQKYPEITFELLKNGKEMTKEKLLTYDFIYLEDGNAFLLRKRLAESGLDAKLAFYVKNGGLLWGAGAGAVILGGQLASALHTDSYCKTLSQGFNFVKNYDVWCHYQAKKDDGFIDAYPRKMIILADDSAAFIEEDRMSMIGPGCLIYEKRCQVLEEV